LSFHSIEIIDIGDFVLGLASKFVTGLNRICDAMFFLASFFMIAIMVIIFLEVFLRYVMGSPTIWALDVTRYILVYLTFLGASNILRTDDHIIIDVVIERLSPEIRRILNIVTSILGAIACLTVFLFSFATTWEHFRSGVLVVDPIEIPKYIPLAIIPIGTLFLFLVFIEKMFGYLVGSPGVGENISEEEST